MALENQFYIYYRREHPCSLGRLDPNCTMNFESVLDLDFNISFLGSLLKIWISGTSLELLRCTNGRSLETCILNSSCNFARWATVWQQKQHMGTHTHTHTCIHVPQIHNFLVEETEQMEGGLNPAGTDTPISVTHLRPLPRPLLLSIPSCW